jgi:hypothetical protein
VRTARTNREQGLLLVTETQRRKEIFAGFDFGNVPVGTTKTMSNFNWAGGAWNGTQAVMVSEGIIGPDASDFSVSPNYKGMTLPYGKSFAYSISFTPSHAGVEAAMISAYQTPNPPFGTALFPITGTGTVPH